MKLVAGLGNPGGRYRGTRHNVGFEVVDRLVTRHGLTLESGPAEALQAHWRMGTVAGAPVAADAVLLAKPLTFMNLSGQAVATLCRYYRIAVSDVLIVCDDVHLPLGRLRARASGTDGGHNGLRSIAEQLGTTEYARLRIGVGRGEPRRSLSNHVLGGFEPDEQTGVEGAMTRSADAVETWVTHGLAQMMSTFNRDVED